MSRLFVALETPPGIRIALESLRDGLAESGADVRWEPGEKLHVTMKFLGETGDASLPAIRESLARLGADVSAVRTRFRSVGCFPNLRAPRVLWAGLDDPEGVLAAMAARVDAAMTALGYKPEDRPFHPHVTLGRVRGSRRLDSLRSKMESVTFESPPVTLRTVCLMKSVLRPEGSVYSTLQTIALVGKRTGAT